MTYGTAAIHRRNNRMDRERPVPPTFRLGDQQCIGPANFFAIVFKKQEILQQVVTRMQDTASATPSLTQHPARPLARCGAQAPQCWDPNLGPPQLFIHGCAPAAISSKDKKHDIG